MLSKFLCILKQGWYSIYISLKVFTVKALTPTLFHKSPITDAKCQWLNRRVHGWVEDSAGGSQQDMTVVTKRRFLSAQIAARKIKCDIKKAPLVAAMDTEETNQ